jgi:hypothetical protein
MNAQYAVNWRNCAMIGDCQPHRVETLGQAVGDTLILGGVVAGAVLAPALLPEIADAGATTEFSYTQTVLNNVASRPYINSPLLTQEIIDSGMGVADPGGIPGALRFDVPGSFNGSQGFYQLVIQPTTNMIYHFLFTSGP